MERAQNADERLPNQRKIEPSGHCWNAAQAAPAKARQHVVLHPTRTAQTQRPHLPRIWLPGAL